MERLCSAVTTACAARVLQEIEMMTNEPHPPRREQPFEEVGADLLEGLLPPRAVWLVRHHLDLLRDRRRTQRHLYGTPELRDLELLRRCDLRGRNPRARVISLGDAFDILYAGDRSELEP